MRLLKTVKTENQKNRKEELVLPRPFHKKETLPGGPASGGTVTGREVSLRERVECSARNRVALKASK